MLHPTFSAVCVEHLCMQVVHVPEAAFEQLTHAHNYYHGLAEALPMFHIKACTYLGSCNATSKLHLYHISPWAQACPASLRSGSAEKNRVTGLSGPNSHRRQPQRAPLREHRYR